MTHPLATSPKGKAPDKSFELDQAGSPPNINKTEGPGAEVAKKEPNAPSQKPDSTKISSKRANHDNIKPVDLAELATTIQSLSAKLDSSIFSGNCDIAGAKPIGKVGSSDEAKGTSGAGATDPAAATQASELDIPAPDKDPILSHLVKAGFAHHRGVRAEAYKTDKGHTMLDALDEAAAGAKTDAATLLDAVNITKVGSNANDVSDDNGLIDENWSGVPTQVFKHDSDATDKFDGPRPTLNPASITPSGGRDWKGPVAMWPGHPIATSSGHPVATMPNHPVATMPKHPVATYRAPAENTANDLPTEATATAVADVAPPSDAATSKQVKPGVKQGEENPAGEKPKVGGVKPVEAKNHTIPVNFTKEKFAALLDQETKEEGILEKSDDHSGILYQIPTTSNGVAPTSSVDAKNSPLKAGEVSEVVRQAADRLELLAATKPKDGVVVHLQPAHLGSITLTVKASGGSIETEITASNENVRTALEQNRTMLGHALEQKGYQLESVTVKAQAESSQTQSQAHNRDMAQQQQSQSQHTSHQRMPYHAHDRSDAAAVTRRPSVNSATGVDYLI